MSGETTGTENRPVRFGIVGCGRMGLTADERAAEWAIGSFWRPLAFATAIAQTPGARLSAFCDPDERALERGRQMFPSVPGYRSLDELFDNESLDVVAVATRTPGRTATLLKAVEAGVRGVLCEKPLANTLETADAVRDRFRKAGAAFVFGTRRRFMPAYRQAKEIVASGEIGTVTSIVVRFGKGMLFWLHPHSLDIASYFTDDAAPEFVQATLDLDRDSIRGNVVDADPVLRSAYVRFRNGVSAHITDAGGFDVEIHGAEGIVSVLRDGRDLRVRTRAGGPLRDDGWLLQERSEEVGRERSGTREVVEAMVRFISNGVSPDYDVSLAVTNSELLFGLVESHLQSGARISFPVPRRGLEITGRYGSLFA
jgi:scyllo-inositol 2-dehydrogenase (NAD+)